MQLILIYELYKSLLFHRVGMETFLTIAAYINYTRIEKKRNSLRLWLIIKFSLIQSVIYTRYISTNKIKMPTTPFK